MTSECMEDFYNAILSDKKDYDYAPVIEYIESHLSDRGFYEVCRSVLAIALNSPRIKGEDGTIQGCFQFKDIDFAVKELGRFMIQAGLKDEKSLLRMVKHRYQDSATSAELDKSVGVVRNERGYDQMFGPVGTFYNFLEIPAWDDVEVYILNKLKDDEGVK